MYSFADITMKRLFLWFSLTSIIVILLSFTLGFLTPYTIYVLLFTSMVLGYTFLCHMWSNSLTLCYSNFGIKIKAIYFVSLCLSTIVAIFSIVFQNATKLQMEQATVVAAIALICHIRNVSGIVNNYASIHYSSLKPDLFGTIKSIVLETFKESISSVLSSTVFIILSLITVCRVLMTLDVIPKMLDVFPTHLPIYYLFIMVFTYDIAVLLYSVILLYILLVSQKTLASVLLFPLNFSKLSVGEGLSIEVTQDQYFFSALTFFCGQSVPQSWKPPTVPVDKFESIYFSEVTLASSHSRNPSWTRILDHYIVSMTQVENQISPTMTGPPQHPYFIIRLGPQYINWIYKLQAFRDLFSVSISSNPRRNRLLQNETAWSVLLHSVCVFLGTLSVQVYKYISIYV